jgi:type IV secretion system protein VirB10
MPGVDLAGYAGLADEVDNHWWKIITGAVFSSVLAATAQRSQGDVGGFQPTFPQVWASNAAGQINQSGQQITQKSLQLQPTITVRPGFSVNVLVTKDIVIPPYNPRGATP